MREALMMVRAILLACAFITAQFSPASASDQTVKQLAEDCGGDEQLQELVCSIYFMAFVDGLEAGSGLYGAKVPICYPASGLSIEDWILRSASMPPHTPKKKKMGRPWESSPLWSSDFHVRTTPSLREAGFEIVPLES